jgi:hypothetical protein
MKLIISAKEDPIKDFSKSCKNACWLLFVGPDVKDFFATRVAPELGEEFHTESAMHQIEVTKLNLTGLQYTVPTMENTEAQKECAVCNSMEYKLIHWSHYFCVATSLV